MTRLEQRTKKKPHMLEAKSETIKRASSATYITQEDSVSMLKVPIVKVTKPVIRSVKVEKPEIGFSLKLRRAEALHSLNQESKTPMYRRQQLKPNIKHVESIKLKPINLFSLKLSKSSKESIITSITLQRRPIRTPIQPLYTVSTVSKETEPKPEHLLKEDIIDMIFGESFRTKLWGRPICIIVPKSDESYEDLVASICREIYLEKKGKKPNPVEAKTFADLEYEPKVEGEIVLIKNVEENHGEKLGQVLRGFYSRDAGYLILVSGSPDMLRSIILKYAPEERENIIILDQDKLSGLCRVRETLLKIVRGHREEYNAEIKGLGVEFKRSVGDFENMLRGNCISYSYLPDNIKEKYDKLMKGEDEITIGLRFAILRRYLNNKIGLLPKLDEGGNIVVDQEVFKADSLQGVGDALSHLVSEFKKNTRYQKIGFVLKNISILMHLKEFLHLVASYEGRLNIYGVFLEDKDMRLLPIQDVAKELAMIYRIL